MYLLDIKGKLVLFKEENTLGRYLKHLPSKGQGSILLQRTFILTGLLCLGRICIFLMMVYAFIRRLVNFYNYP